jgi:hypothetical protein
MKKKIAVLLCSLCVIEFFPVSLVSASETNLVPSEDVVEVNDGSQTEIVSEVNIDDISGEDNTTIVDSDGNYIGTLTVKEEVSSNIGLRQAGDKYKLANKTYSVSFIGVTCNFGYKVSVKNKKITNAYGSWSNGILWSTSLGKPYHTSTTSGMKGQVSIGISEFTANTTVRLTANISGNYLVTGMKLS